MYNYPLDFKQVGKDPFALEMSGCESGSHPDPLLRITTTDVDFCLGKSTMTAFRILNSICIDYYLKHRYIKKQEGLGERGATKYGKAAINAT